MLEGDYLSSASRGLFNLRAKLRSDIYGAAPRYSLLILLGAIAIRSLRIENVYKMEMERDRFLGGKGSM